MKIVKVQLGKASLTVEKEYWNINNDYPKLTVVEHKDLGICFLSRKPVPAGTTIYNRNYWIKLGVGNSPSPIYSTVSITTDKISYNKGTVNVQVNLKSDKIATITVKRDDNIIYEGYGNDITFVDTFIENEAKTINYVAEFTINEETFIDSCSIKIVNDVYFGASNNYQNLINSEHKSHLTDVKGRYEINNETNGNYIWFIIPADATINKATLSDILFPLYSIGSDTIDNVEYTIYRSSNTYDICLITIELE